MPAGEHEIFGPVAYAPHWLWIGLGLAAIALVTPLAWWWLTRPRRASTPAPTPAPHPLDEARAAIAHVRAGHDDGTLTARAAHLELSRAVRRFVARVSHRPVDRMGLADLRAAMEQDPRLAGLTDYLTLLSPPSFGPEGSGNVAAAADRADDLVTRWAAAREEGAR